MKNVNVIQRRLNIRIPSSRAYQNRARLSAAPVEPSASSAATVSAAPSAELEMPTIPACPLCTRNQTAAIGKRDLVGRHSRLCSISSILIDVESEPHRVQRVPNTSMSAITAHEPDRIPLPIERRHQALEGARRTRRNARRCAMDRSDDANGPARTLGHDPC